MKSDSVTRGSDGVLIDIKRAFVYDGAPRSDTRVCSVFDEMRSLSPVGFDPGARVGEEMKIPPA